MIGQRQIPLGSSVFKRDVAVLTDISVIFAFEKKEEACSTIHMRLLNAGYSFCLLYTSNSRGDQWVFPGVFKYQSSASGCLRRLS